MPFEREVQGGHSYPWNKILNINMVPLASFRCTPMMEEHLKARGSTTSSQGLNSCVDVFQLVGHVGTFLLASAVARARQREKP